jgi:hypothetical protein
MRATKSWTRWAFRTADPLHDAARGGRQAHAPARHARVRLRRHPGWRWIAFVVGIAMRAPFTWRRCATATRCIARPPTASRTATR